MKVFSTILLFMLSLAAFAQTPISWQKVELEEKVLHKVRTNLRNVLEQNQFLVEVEVQVNDPGMPNFDDLTKKGSKVSDVKFDDSKGDYIAFSKVGLEVPVVEEFHKDNQHKLKEMYRYNEAFDIFKNIDEVKIDVHLSDQLKPDQVEIAKNVVDSLKFTFLGDIKPKVNVKTLKLEEKKLPPAPIKKEDAKPEEKLTLKDILNFISRFGNALGLIVATLILAIASWLLLKKYFQLKKDLADAKKKEEEEKEEVPPPAEEPLQEVPAEPEYALSSQENFGRLRHFMSTQPQDSMIMVKNWINNSTADNQMALKALAQQLSDEELMSVFKGLNDFERERWKDHLDQFMDDQQLAQANQYISEEVVRTMIDPGKVKDLELIDLVIGLSLDIACKYVVERPEQGKILMNLLTPVHIGKILNKLSEDKAEVVVAHSLDCDLSQVTDGFAGFKRDLNTFVAQQKRKPFNAKIMQMVGDFNPLKETLLYNFLAKSGMKEEMITTAKANIPYECIMLLSKDVMKDFMQAYPMNKKVQFLSVCEDDMKSVLLKSFADEGSSARQMIDLEFESLNSDKMAVSRLQLQKDTIVKEFVMYVREYLASHKEAEQEVEFAVNDWLQTFESQRPDLKIVA